ncbi:MAG: VWA domain-containing protein [Chloroflexi bacterium]|nr:VWA domain-containing protein [Chloroflexota bacterium]
MWLYQYSRWDGTQAVFPVDADDVMDLLSDTLMGQGDLSSALHTLTQRGIGNRQGKHVAGLQELLQQLRQRRQQVLDRYDLASALKEVKEELRQVAELEEKGIQQRLEEAQQKRDQLRQQGKTGGLEEELLSRLERLAHRNQEFIRGLPQDPAAAITQLQQYEFMDPGAKAKFDALVKRLQEQVLKTHFQELVSQVRGLTPGDLQATKEMVQQLNKLLEERLQGGRPDIRQFLERWGQALGGRRPTTLEELVEQLQEQLSRMESFLSSLDPQQRKELQDALAAALKDQGLLNELARLAANLESLHPMGALRRQYAFHGQEPVTLEEALAVVDQLQGMDELERQLKRTSHGARLAEVDPSLLQEVLGPEALQDLEQLRHITDLLENAGYIRRVGGRFELTPKGVRKIGQQALREIFAYIKKERHGNHLTRTPGQGGEHVDGAKRYEFGDPLDIHLGNTLFNAVLRGGQGVPLHLVPEDFEVHRTEQQALASTVLMIDLSLSMVMRGNFLAAKKVALALDNLIRTMFPRDILYVVGFSTYAREVKPEKLPYLTWDEFDPYTNIQHGLALAQKLLGHSPAGSKQIVLISDGEPTAHIEGGQLFLQYPPSPRTIRETLREVRRCTSRGIVINTFMLDRSAYLVEFVDQMTRINRGRVFYTTPERLGQYLLVDYYTNRKRVLL